MIWSWVTEGDGFIILVCSWNVLLLVFVIIWAYRTDLRVMRCEIKVQGFRENLMDVRVQATRVGDDLRRVTGGFDKIVDEELATAGTRIRDRIGPGGLKRRRGG